MATADGAVIALSCLLRQYWQTWPVIRTVNGIWPRMASRIDRFLSPAGAEQRAPAELSRRLVTPRGEYGLVIGVLLASLLVRLLLFPLPGFYYDLSTLATWYSQAADVGIRGFYDAVPSCEYPPVNVYVFWVFGKLAQAIGPQSVPFLLKLPQNLFDVATAALIFVFVRHRLSFRTSLIVMSVYAFNPATIYELAVWGQMDSYYAFFMVASLVAALRSRYEVSGALLGLGVLTKPQALLVLPVVAYVILMRGGWRRALSSGAVFWGAVLLVILPFRWENPVTFLIGRYWGYGAFPYTAVNTYNFWALAGFGEHDTAPLLGLTPQLWGVLGFCALLGVVLWQLHRKYGPEVAAYCGFLLVFGFFMVMTRMHERYLFPAFAFLAMALRSRLSALVYAGLTATFLANLAYALARLNAFSGIPDGHWSVFVLVPANAFLLALSLYGLFRLPRRPTGSGVDRTATRR